MAKDYIPLAIRIKEATQKLKNAGYSVINNDDKNFAILAEKKKIICKDHIEFFKITLKLTQEWKQNLQNLWSLKKENIAGRMPDQTRVFGSTELFNLWLNRDHVLLECKPITLWETKKGLQMIYGELVHIEYGECC